MTSYACVFWYFFVIRSPHAYTVYRDFFFTSNIQANLGSLILLVHHYQNSVHSNEYSFGLNVKKKHRNLIPHFNLF